RRLGYPVPFFFSSRRRHTRLQGDWSSDVCSSDLYTFDPFGNLITILDADNYTSSYTYNIRGFKTASNDADTGSWTFTPDSLNERSEERRVGKECRCRGSP